MSDELSYQQLKEAVADNAAAFRCVTKYQPAGGRGDKVFPPTYESGKYARENRRIVKQDGGEMQEVPCVLLDSVQSQANRMEMALLDAREQELLPLPVISVEFSDKDVSKVLRITSLEAPHRIADALLRDSLLGDEQFRRSEKGRQLDHVDNRNATPLFEMCPTALIFGMWDSTGPRGGLGAKFARAMVSEIVGINAVFGVKTSSRIDPAEIQKNAGPIFRTPDRGWTLNQDAALKSDNKLVLFKQSKGKDVLWDPEKDNDKVPDQGRPSVANHGNIPPTVSDDTAGGVTVDEAVQTTVLSLPALRRLRFPLNGSKSDPKVDEAARTVLAALGLCAATLFQEQGCDLRSRCQLVPVDAFEWELIGRPGEEPKHFTISAQNAVNVYTEAVKAATDAGLPWMKEELKLVPSPELVALVRKSQKLAANEGVEEGGE